ncbi:hypothetical protein b23_0030 [Synechococcus phage B23]|nr:hypothetical protein b23_0030 [Synechococcus phage B23]
MPTVQGMEKIHITDVQIFSENEKYFVRVDYSDGESDEFGPYRSHEEAKSIVF